jgi:polar amino acid transport system ATP-binding protein
MRLDRVAKSYGSNKVFEDISLSIPNGGSVLVQGPSGCGKSTLLRCMALLEPINSGYIEFEGYKVLSPDINPHPEHDVRLGIGMVFQHLYLWPHLTVLENVALPLRLVLRESKRVAAEEARKALELLNIAEKEKEYPLSLSGGQQQRVALARALVHSPKLLLLDEITANLDEATSKRVLEAVERIWRRGTAIVLVSHAAQIPHPLKKVVFRYEAGSWRTEPTQSSA